MLRQPPPKQTDLLAKKNEVDLALPFPSPDEPKDFLCLVRAKMALPSRLEQTINHRNKTPRTMFYYTCMRSRKMDSHLRKWKTGRAISLVIRDNPARLVWTPEKWSPQCSPFSPG